VQHEYFTNLNKYFIKQYSDVFSDTLSDRLSPSEAPHHRIILKNEDISLNGRMYSTPTHYWNKLKEFIDMRIKGGCIHLSPSHIASGTIIVPKTSDPDGIPRVVHDYRALNVETVKDHIALMHQEDPAIMSRF